MPIDSYTPPLNSSGVDSTPISPATTPRTSFSGNTEITHAPQSDAPIHQRVRNQIETSTHNFLMAVRENPLDRIMASFMLGAIGGVAIVHHAGFHEPVDMVIAGTMGGVAGGTSLAAFVGCMTHLLHRPTGTEMSEDADTNDVGLELLSSPANNNV